MHRSKTVSYWEGGGRCGWVAEVYTDDDSNSGFGNNAMVGFWYGTREECEALDPDTVELSPIN